MVLIDNKKFACQTCIKGHRSTSCTHTDRPLSEIKRKGRPITQCQHCRELRKSKQVHVKCICSNVEEKSPASTASACTSNDASANSKAPNPAQTAAIMSGLSVCPCGSSDDCRCCTPRYTPAKGKSQASVPLDSRSKTITQADYEYENNKKRSKLKKLLPKASTPAHLISRIAGLRPLFPKPSKRDGPGDLRVEDPPSHTRLHRPSASMVNNPYQLAYEHNREIAARTTNQDHPSQSPDPSVTDRPHSRSSFSGSSEASIVQGMRTTCRCGNGCSCQGCHLNASEGASASGTCTNPGACDSCLDCAILSLPDHVPLDAPLAAFDQYQTEFIDTWIRQVTSTPGDASYVPPAGPFPGLQNGSDAASAEVLGYMPFLPAVVPGERVQAANGPGYLTHSTNDFPDYSDMWMLPRQGQFVTPSEEDLLVNTFEGTAGNNAYAQMHPGDRFEQNRRPYPELYPDGFSTTNSLDRSLSPLTTSSQSSLFSAHSPVANLEDAWNSSSSVVDALGNIQVSSHSAPQSTLHLAGRLGDSSGDNRSFVSMAQPRRLHQGPS